MISCWLLLTSELLCWHTHTGEMQVLAHTAFVATKQGWIPCSTLNIQLKFDVAMVTGKEGHYCPKLLPSTQAISALLLRPHQPQLWLPSCLTKGMPALSKSLIALNLPHQLLSGHWRDKEGCKSISEVCAKASSVPRECARTQPLLPLMFCTAYHDQQKPMTNSKAKLAITWRDAGRWSVKTILTATFWNISKLQD